MKNFLPIVMSFIFLCIVLHSPAQDSALIRKIESDARYIYDHSDKQYRLLTKQSLISMASDKGTEIIVYTFQDTINRIVCIGYNNDGKWAKEFTVYNNRLIFVYVTQNYFMETKEVPPYKNFMGLPTIEMRYYYSNDHLIAATYEGITDKNTVNETADMLPEECRRLVEWIKKNIK